MSKKSINWEHRAGVVWPVLAELAKNNGALTCCEDLAPLIDTNPLSVRHGLSPIQNFCLENDLPPLTVLVVGKISGKPGTGFIGCDANDLEEKYQQVYGHNWEIVENPFGGFGIKDITESFAQTLVNEPERTDEIYAKVKSRGSLQQIFREALLGAYDRQCAMCGLSFEEALEAAHIIPWGKCEHKPKLRISPKNGILLCANHHKLFDSGIISVTKEYKIKYEYAGSGLYHSESDKQASTSLNGKSLCLPKKENLYPDLGLLKHHDSSHA